MEDTETRYTIVVADDHKYLCPVDRREEARERFKEIREYWRPNGDFEGDPPREPDFVRRIGGSLSLLSFTDPQIQ